MKDVWGGSENGPKLSIQQQPLRSQLGEYAQWIFELLIHPTISISLQKCPNNPIYFWICSPSLFGLLWLWYASNYVVKSWTNCVAKRFFFISGKITLESSTPHLPIVDRYIGLQNWRCNSSGQWLLWMVHQLHTFERQAAFAGWSLSKWQFWPGFSLTVI